MEISGVTIDCADTRKLAAFWTEALGYEVVTEFGDDFLFLAPPGAKRGEARYLGLQRVPEARAAKNRVHIDFHVEDRPKEVERLVGLGASVLGEHVFPGGAWTVLTDPEGNEFCVASHHG